MTKILQCIRITVLCCFLFFFCQWQPVLAQGQDEFGPELLQIEPIAPETDPAKLTIDARLSNTYNNHIELGLSVDPYTSSLAGQESPQLQGNINRFGLDLIGTLPVAGDKLRLKLQFSPQYENYSGKSGKLNEFDAFTDVSTTELSYRPFPGLPELVASHRFHRLTRTLNVYNNTERNVGFRIGRIFEYNMRIHNFDDTTQLREDFLLIGSTNHKATTRLQFGLLKQVLAKMESSVEYGQYDTNLNNLILGTAGLEPGESRLDLRYSGGLKLLETVPDRFVFQEEANFFFNRSNVDFFNFISMEAALNTFYKFGTGRWIRLRFARVWVLFDGRQIRDESGNIMEGAENRRDTQFGFTAAFNWHFTGNLSLNMDYQFTQNRTNELDSILDFLNYNHSIVSVTLREVY